VIERGGHTELIAVDGRYAGLWRREQELRGRPTDLAVTLGNRADCAAMEEAS
jgi:hypothetical protein